MSSARPAPWHLQCALALAAVLVAEQTLRAFVPSSHHLFTQRQEELYGWLSMLALLLVLASRWLGLVPYRRAFGLLAFGFALIHTWLAFAHVLGADPENVLFLSLEHQIAVWLGVIALVGLLPLALTSTNAAMKRLGKRWKALHRAGPVMTVLAAVHTAVIGVHFGLNPPAWTSVALLVVTAALYFFRRRLTPIRPRRHKP